MTKSPKPAWLPDWRDDSQYPEPESTNRTLLAWEFLRRNQDYQFGWEKLNEEFPLDRTQSGRLTVTGYKGFNPSVWEDYGRDWGIDGIPPSPSVNSPPEIRFDCSVWLQASRFAHDERGQAVIQQSLAPRHPQEIVIRLPLNRSTSVLKTGIGSVIKYAKLVSGVVDDQGDFRIRENALPRNLRVFDANLCGIQVNEIANHLFPYADFDQAEANRKKIQAALTTAQEFVDWKYILIPELEIIHHEIAD